MQIDVMLCDHAQVTGEKLFITGGNINRFMAQPQPHGPYPITFAAAGIITVPWLETNAPHQLTFRLLDEDGNTPLLPGEEAPRPEGIGGQLEFNVGRSPQAAEGEDQIVPFAFAVHGLPLPNIGRYTLVFALDGSEVRRLPFSLVYATRD